MSKSQRQNYYYWNVHQLKMELGPLKCAKVNNVIYLIELFKCQKGNFSHLNVQKAKIE